MRTNPLSRAKPLLLLLSFTLALNGCETIQIAERHPCAVNDTFQLGSTCAGTISGATSQMTEDDTIAMLQRAPDVTNPDGTVKKGHAPGVFESADDYETETVELDLACRLLGANCSYALAQTVRTRKLMLENIREKRLRQ